MLAKNKRKRNQITDRGKMQNKDKQKQIDLLMVLRCSF